MATYEIEFKKSIWLTEEDITDIIITALEGGIGYWACLDNTSDKFENAPKDEPISETATKILLDGGELRFLDEEDRWDGIETEYILTLDKLLKGIRKYVEEAGMNVLDGDGLDIFSLDSIAADSIVQYAIFCEIVYG